MSAQKLTLPSPAKLNLMLHILGRREDGYHELQTLFQFLDYGDELTFAIRDDGAIKLHTEFDGVPHDSNLIVRAAKKLQEQSGCALGIDIWIDKILPMGGGIGGGSSNAATTLLGLNHLWQLGWDLDRLATLGLTLGADVPVFVRGHAAFAEGVGEKLTGLEPFHPERMASRILGMGDVLSLIEDVQKGIDQDEAQKMMKKMKSGKGFDLEDFKAQIQQMKKMGGMAFSTLHANFMINEGKGSATAALALMQEAKEAVLERFGIALEPEVRIIPCLFP